MSLLDRYGESIARSMDRRKFVKRIATATFSFATAAVISIESPKKAHAASCPVGNNHYSGCSCHPPGVGYCWANGYSCNGYNCGHGCSIDKFFWPNNGCWCSDTCYNGSQLTYFVCCDCKCGTTSCGCESEYWL